MTISLFSCGQSGDHEGHDHVHGEEHAHGEHAEPDGHDHEDEGTEQDGHNHGADGVVEFCPSSAKEIGMLTEKAKKGDFSEVIKTSGQILSASGSEHVISAPVAGIVSFSNNALAVGSQVNAGQPLFSITSQGTADGDISSANAAALQSAQRAYDRAKTLYDKQMITLAEYQDAEAALAQAKAAHSGSANRAAGGSLGVSSRIGGYVISLDVKPGTYVTAGQQMATVAQQRRLQLRADISERNFAQASAIRDANIIMPSMPDKTIRLADHNGKIVSKGQSAGMGHTMPMYFEFDNPGHLVNGAYVEVYLLGTPDDDVLTVPSSALVEEQGLYYVFVKKNEDHYKKTPVETGVSDGVRTIIRSGLHEGDEVVTKGAYTLKMKSNAGSVPGHTHNH